MTDCSHGRAPARRTNLPRHRLCRGHYLGELRDGRLITHLLRKETHRWYGFFANPELTKGTEEGIADGAALPMPDGYEDFPDLTRSAA